MKFTKEQKQSMIDTGFIEILVSSVLIEVFQKTGLNQYLSATSNIALALLGRGKVAEMFIPEELHESIIEALDELKECGVSAMSLEEIQTPEEHYNFRFLLNTNMLFSNRMNLQKRLSLALDTIAENIDDMLNKLLILKGYQNKGQDFVHVYNKIIAENMDPEEAKAFADQENPVQAEEPSEPVESVDVEQPALEKIELIEAEDVGVLRDSITDVTDLEPVNPETPEIQ